MSHHQDRSWPYIVFNEWYGRDCGDALMAEVGAQFAQGFDFCSPMVREAFDALLDAVE